VREEGYVGLNNSINGAPHFISTLANNTLTINLPGSMPHATLSIIDLTGRKQLTCEVTTHGTVDVSCLSKGIYLTQLACNGQTVTERLVKN